MTEHEHTCILDFDHGWLDPCTCECGATLDLIAAGGVLWPNIHDAEEYGKARN